MLLPSASDRRRTPHAVGLAFLALFTLGLFAGRWSATGFPASRGSVTEQPPISTPLRDSAFATWTGWLDQKLAVEREDADVWQQVLDAPPSRALLQARLARYADRAGGVRITDWRVLSDSSDLRISQLQVTPDDAPGLPVLLIEPSPADSALRPAILALHGADGRAQSLLEDIDYHHGFAAALARCGFVVVAPVQPGATLLQRSSLWQKALVLGESLLQLEIRALRAVLDVLENIDGVDPQRLLVYGISLGGRQALLLAAVDERVTGTIVSGHFADRASWLLGPDSMPRRIITPDRVTLLEPDMGPLLDDLNTVALIAPRHFLVEVGTSDTRHDAAASLFDDVNHIYEAAGAPERARLIAFDGGHETSVQSVLPVLHDWHLLPSTGPEAQASDCPLQAGVSAAPAQ